jgi:hypothetical protein
MFKKLPPIISRAEAHFWLVFLELTAQGVRVDDPQFDKVNYDGSVDLSAIRHASDKVPELAIILNALLPLEEQVTLYCEVKDYGDYGFCVMLQAGFRKYILPYLTENERQRIRPHVRLLLKALPTPLAYYGHREAYPVLYMAAAMGGFSDEIEAYLPELYDSRGWGDDDLDSSQLANVIFGLDDPAKVEKYMRQKECYFWRRHHVIGWLAHTETRALDWVVKSINQLTKKADAPPLFEALTLVDDETVVLPILELQKSVIGMHAAGWLDEHPELAARGSALAIGNPLAEAYLKRLSQQGKRDILQAAQTVLPPDQQTEFQQRFIDAKITTIPALTNENTPVWLKDALVLPPKKVASPGWVAMIDLPPLLVDGCALNDEQGTALLTALKLSTHENPHPIVPALKAHLPATMLDNFAWGLFELWLARGGEIQEKWGILTLGLMGGEMSALKLTPYLLRWPGESQHKRAELGLACLCAIGNDTALMQINRIAQKSEFSGFKSMARKAIEKIATARNLTQDQLRDRIVPDCGLNDSGQRVLDYGSRRFTFVLTADLKPFVRDEAGKVKADLPKPGKNDDTTLASEAFATWKLIKKQVRETLKLETERLERALVDRRRWSLDEFENFLVRHPLMTHLTQRLLWGTYDQDGRLVMAFRVTAERDYANLDDDRITFDRMTPIRLVHPVDLTVESISEWNRVFTDYEIVSPFPQLARKVYTLLSRDVDATEITGFDIKIETLTLVGLFSRLHWKADAPVSHGVTVTAYKVFPAQNVAAILPLSPGYRAYLPTIGVDDQQIQSCYFVAQNSANTIYGYLNDRLQKIRLGDIDPLVISEVLSDLTVMQSRAKV